MVYSTSIATAIDGTIYSHSYRWPSIATAIDGNFICDNQTLKNTLDAVAAFRTDAVAAFRTDAVAALRT